MDRRHRLTLVIIAALLAIVAGVVGAEQRYEDRHGRFITPVPDGWTMSATADAVRFEHADPAGVVHVLAPIGAELRAVAAALAMLVDPGLDDGFAVAPLQVQPVPLPSGAWTQRNYQIGDQAVAAFSLERAGYTVVVLAQASERAFATILEAATREVLLGLEVLIAEPDVDDPTDHPFEILQVSFDSEEHTLVGTLTLPYGDAPHPGLVVVAGSGAQDRDGKNPSLPGYTPLRWLADHLTRHGFAVLRFDERGIGASGGDHASATTSDLANDVAAGLLYLANHPAVDVERVGVLGHSEGAMIAASLAASLPEVAFVIALGGPAVPTDELLAVQVQRIAEANAADESEVAEAVERQRQVTRLVQARDWEALEEYLMEAGAERLERLPPEQRERLGDIDALVELQARTTMAALQSPWMTHFLDVDPREDWRRVTVPVLALFGALDVQVDLDQNRDPLETALAEAGNDDVTVHVFPRANHLFLEAVSGDLDEYHTLEMAFVPSLLEAISDWLAERFMP